MFEWLPVFRSMFKAVKTARRQTAGLVKDIKNMTELSAESTAMIATANLRFDAPGMKAVAEKIASGDASGEDLDLLTRLLDESLDDVTMTLNGLSWDEAFGKVILKKQGLSAGEFVDLLRTLKMKIRMQLLRLLRRDPRNPSSVAEAKNIIEEINLFNSKLEEFHSKVFGPTTKRAATTRRKRRAKNKSNLNKSRSPAS